MENYTLQIAVMILIVLGGIGFPVLIGLYSDLKYYLKILYRKLRGRLMPIRPGKRNVARKIVIVTTLFLIFTGAGLYYFFEDKTSLSGMTAFRKIMISFFGSISARTAGFNVTDITLWSYPTIFLIIILMYIGASPGSTGGGIKTTTFAIALRSTWNNIRGKNQFMIGNREIGNFTITRVLSIIVLSIIVVFSGFMIMMATENGKDPVSLLFECFSAYGTVGLSITDSSTLTSPGKIIDMLLMFIGRVGPLTLLSGFLISYRKKYSRYPEEEIIIN